MKYGSVGASITPFPGITRLNTRASNPEIPNE